NMMQEALPGKVALDLTPDSGADTEVEEDGISLHGFWEPNELLFYVAATQEGGADTVVDFSGLVTDAGRVEISILGVADGAPIGSNNSDAVVEAIDPALVLSGTDLSVQMDQGEIMQVRMFDFIPSQGFQDVISNESPESLPDPLIDDFADETEAMDPAPAPAGIDFPTVAATAGAAETLAFEEAQAVAETEAEEEDDDAGGMADLMMFLPFLGILAMFM
ncbi:MAG: hypothetical protein NWQ37_12895, partial [Marivita lacus]|nr:hypothetical protein [Marivita lacus]